MFSEGESIFWAKMSNGEMIAAIKWASRNGFDEMAKAGKDWFRRYRLKAIVNPLGYEDWQGENYVSR